MIFFSIIIPVYNSEKTIIRTLKSLVAQTYQNWTCILVDDSSADQSINLIKEFISKDKRFVLIERADHSNIKGANSCRNIGIDYSDSKWIVFVDSDDTLNPNCLATRRKEILENPHKDIYIFRTAVADNLGEIIWEFTCLTKDIPTLVYKLYTHHIPWHTMSLIWEKDFLIKIKGWNVNFERLQDVELNIRALLTLPQLYFSDQPWDSIYWQSEMDYNKKRLARFGFCRLVKDYHFKILDKWGNNDEYFEKISSASENILNYHIQNYICFEKKDSEWESLYLSTLSDLNFSKAEVNISKEAFSKKK